MHAGCASPESRAPGTTQMQNQFHKHTREHEDVAAADCEKKNAINVEENSQTKTRIEANKMRARATTAAAMAAAGTNNITNDTKNRTREKYFAFFIRFNSLVALAACQTNKITIEKQANERINEAASRIAREHGQ